MSPVQSHLESLHERFRELDAGEVASYIPELAKASRHWFGICVATADGHVYEVGDTRIPFTLQSISKPFVFGLALEDRGKAAVLEKIGVEPTGDAFNEISLEPGSGRPRNPMINAGAITASSLVAGRSDPDCWERILALFSLYAGRPLELDPVVFRSERDTGHRNRAIGHMLRNAGILKQDPERALELYFRQCSIRATCRDVSLMAATLAAGGVNPVTRERALSAGNVDEVLSVMTTCGMYDYAGSWLYRVGLPAKSGVSGGILAVLPGQLGIAVFSPPLDARGNSVRGVAVCEAMADEFGLHFLRAPRPALSAVRSRRTAAEIGSRRVRTGAERAALAESGHRAVVYRLQGDLGFAAAEAAVRRIAGETGGVAIVAVELSRVHDVDPAAARLLLELWLACARLGRALVFVGLPRHPRLQRLLEEEVWRRAARRVIQFPDLDAALEWCENFLLAASGVPRAGADELPLAQHEWLRGLGAEALERLASRMQRRELAPREFAVRRGDPADALFLVVQGELSVLVEGADGQLHRLSTLSAGMGFGEPSLADGGTRTASVRADSRAVCWVLGRAAYQALDGPDQSIRVQLLENLLRSSTRIVARLTGEALAADA